MIKYYSDACFFKGPNRFDFSGALTNHADILILKLDLFSGLNLSANFEI
jgi:hypothetical protein